MFALSLAAIRNDDAREVGAKAAKLARMMRSGLPVPAGFCITGRAYREALGADDGLERIRQRLAELAAAGGRNRPAVMAEIRRSISAATLAAELREEVGHHWRGLGAPSVAIRSSATAEDLPQQSFAGQYDTFLGVTDLEICLQRVKDCWASLWSDRALQYRWRNGVDHLAVSMAVIVQTLVPAEAAGVMFSADPVSGRRDCAIVEACFGLGEAVVTGKVRPDRIVVSKRVFHVERRVTAHKTVEVLPSESGLAREQVADDARAARPCLDDATACRLALLGSDVESLLGGPQDIEWAIAEGRVELLQARPITALPPEPQRTLEDRQIWTDANLREVVPDVMTPMTWSGIEALGEPFIGPIFRRLGIDVDPYQLANLIAGRVYFNVNTLVAIGKALPGGSRLDGSVVFGGGGPGAEALPGARIPKEDLPRLRRRRCRFLLSLPALLWLALRHPMRRGRSILMVLNARLAEMAQEPWRSLSDEDLARRILSADRVPKEELLRRGRGPLLALAGMGHFLLLMALCRRWLGVEGENIARRLLAGLGGMEDADAGIALWQMAATAHGNAKVEAAVREEERFADVARRLAGMPEAEPFLAAWSEFLATHGHHTRGEFELRNARWAEQPDYVLGLVRSHMAGVGRVDPVAQARRLAQERRRLAQACRGRLRNPIQRLIFDAVLSRAQEGLRFRETLKSRVVHYMWLVRQMLVELGERLARRGILAQSEDVFFLEKKELEGAVSGSFDPRAVIAQRRAEYERNAARDPPTIVFGRFDPAQSAAEVVHGHADMLRGIGVSPGVAAGKTRVILHAGEGHVMPGEVLVAPFTDPGWAPYFLNAAAIVMDQGGLLSHGSIVAREYGIPCVVNVGPATKILRTGQTAEVDGDRGLVRILD